jgi:hypothetical protein
MLERSSGLVFTFSYKHNQRAKFLLDTEPLSWHRLRHTWAERMAEMLADQPNGTDRLVYLGGWTNPLSARRYIHRALARRAAEAVREYHRKLLENLRTGASEDTLLHWLSATNPEGAINRMMRRFVRAASLTSPRTNRHLRRSFQSR